MLSCLYRLSVAVKRLQKLSDLHYAAMRMRIEGMRSSDIARELNVVPRTVHLWFSDPLVKAELERQRGRVFEVFADKLTDIGLRAMNELERLAERDIDGDVPMTINQKLDVLREILDRNPLTAKQNGEGGAGFPARGIGGPPGGPPDGVSDAELIRMARETADGLPVLEARVSNNGSS